MKVIPALLLAFLPLPALAHGDLHERIHRLTARLLAEPANAALLLERGELYRQHGEVTEALDDFTAAGKLDPGLAGLDLARARACFASRDWPAARHALDRHLTRHPDHAVAFVLRARCRLALGDSHGAVADFDRGIGLSADPQPDDYLDRCAAILALGRADEALRGLEEGIARIGSAIALQLRAIELEAAAGRFDAALHRVSQASAAAPPQAFWLEKRAALLRQSGRNVEAIASARAGLALVDALPVARRSTASTAELEGRLRALLAVSP